VTVMVGLSPAARDDAGGAVALAVRLATALDDDVTVAVVVGAEPAGDTTAAPPASVGDDGEHGAEIAAARAAVEPVLARGGRGAHWTTVEARSPAEALLEVARGCSASLIVLGTDPDGSGRVAVRVARAAPVPVALARPGTDPGAPITRVTCAYSGTRGADRVLAAAADLARRAGAALRVASFAVQRGATIPPEVGLDAEASVTAGWAGQIAGAQSDALARAGLEADTGVYSGPSWDAAVHGADWGEGDLLVVGSTPGAATRLFFGDRVGAILRASPVPAVIINLA
jgi:nucleotide-binding universal stress UspA family protein